MAFRSHGSDPVKLHHTSLSLARDLLATGHMLARMLARPLAWPLVRSRSRARASRGRRLLAREQIEPPLNSSAPFAQRPPPAEVRFVPLAPQIRRFACPSTPRGRAAPATRGPTAWRSGLTAIPYLDRFRTAGPRPTKVRAESPYRRRCGDRVTLVQLHIRQRPDATSSFMVALPTRFSANLREELRSFGRPGSLPSLGRVERPGDVDRAAATTSDEDEIASAAFLCLRRRGPDRARVVHDRPDRRAAKRKNCS